MSMEQRLNETEKLDSGSLHRHFGVLRTARLSGMAKPSGLIKSYWRANSANRNYQIAAFFRREGDGR
jgi:hypothetical protein